MTRFGTPIAVLLVMLMANPSTASFNSQFDVKSPAIRAMIQREIQRPKPLKLLGDLSTPTDIQSISPHTASVLGGLLDSLSTYRFLKQGTASEDNALVSGLNNSPAKVGGLGLAMVPAIQVAGHLLHKKYPRVADALLSNQGALQIGYGANNMKVNGNQTEAASTQYGNSIQRNIQHTIMQQLQRP